MDTVSLEVIKAVIANLESLASSVFSPADMKPSFCSGMLTSMKFCSKTLECIKCMQYVTYRDMYLPRTDTEDREEI